MTQPVSRTVLAFVLALVAFGCSVESDTGTAAPPVGAAAATSVAAERDAQASTAAPDPRGDAPLPDTKPTDPSHRPNMPDAASSSDLPADPSTASGLRIATFGAGCYWCVEAVLEQLEGVADVTSGFMGGHVTDPSYEAVCSGTTGHAEVVQVHFDPQRISYEALLGWFWKLHDPTTLNRQGADRGTQYRSVIFYHDDSQRLAAERSNAAADASGAFADPIVTEISAASTYYLADTKHQDFYRGNREYGYCRAVIAPKLGKLGLDK